jgi:hypothetical protein
VTALSFLIGSLIVSADAVRAQISPNPADAVVPVVGSTRGAGGANFKTELQMANPTDGEMSGWLYLRPQGRVKRYEVVAHGTLSFDDVVAEMGGSGLGSLDILAEVGGIPTVVARAYDDQESGTTGVTVPAVAQTDVLANGDLATLIAPHRLGTRYRFNIGVRAMLNGAMLSLVVRNAAGAQRHARIVTFDANAFVQQPADAFAGIALAPDDSIEITFESGSAIVYATTVDNVTNDSSIQVLVKRD